MGLIAGIIAKLLMPGKDPGGCIITILIGIAGAVLGGWLAKLLGFNGMMVFDFRSLITAVIGAFILLAIYRMLKR
jgi:uncharacterized membrane protein YeaQ/YmgE (transglycosylase-associated protein family)